MDILQEVKDVIAQQHDNKKQDRLEQLSSIFEHWRDLDKVEVGEAVQTLLTAALQEKPENRDMREAFFHAIDSAVVFQDVGDLVDWDALIPSLPSLERASLEYALNVLGLSGQEKYLPIIETYAQHTDPETRTWANEAINELTYRLAHSSDAQNGG